MDINDSINYDNQLYISILIFSISSFIIFLLYFLSIIIYLKQNYHTKKINLFWINYSIINFVFILFLGLYILKLFIRKKERENSPNLLSSDFLSVIINILLVMFIYSIITNLILDFISAFKAYDKIKKLSLINIKESKYLELKLKEIKLQNIFNENSYFIFFIIVNIIHIGFLLLFILAYLDTNITRTAGFFNINHFFNYLVKNYYFIVLLCFLVYMILLTKWKKLLMNSNYYNPNLFDQKLFNIYSNRAIYYTNILNYQFIIEALLNIPIILFLLIQKISILSFIILYFSMFSYIYLGGTFYLNLDENNNVTDFPTLVKKLFCFNNKTIYFRDKKIKDVFDDFIYHYDNNETTKINDLELTLFKKYRLEKLNDPQSNMYPLQTNDDKIFNSSRKLFNYDPNLINRNISILDKRNNSDFPKSNKKTVIDFTSLCDYYIIYKLLYLYFKENRDVYDNLFRKMNDDTGVFKKILFESNPFRRKSSLGLNTSLTNNNFGHTVNKQDFITNIERISRISIIDSKKIKTSLKLSNNDLILSLEEKDLFDEFKLKYGFDNSDIDFKIESMFSENFSEISPFFQLKIDDIIKALIPSHNKKYFNIFMKKISPFKNKIEQNLFMTYDSLLIIEVYEQKEFLSSDDLKKFVFHYKKYLTDTVKNLDYTFLPLLVGIFNIDISGLNKIVIMYRNPLHFTLYNHFNNWITFYINESTEKLKASLILDDVIDLNEIEVKNALKINEADYDEVKKNFKQDLLFIKEVNVPIYPVVRLFIGDENNALKNMDSNNLGFNKNYKATNMNEPSVLDESTHKQQNLSDLLEISDMGNLSLSKKISNDIFENELNSILEREYYSMSGNDIHTIKIYFTNLFRTGNELTRKKRDFLNDNKDDVSLSYRKFIEDELFNYLSKASSFLDDKEKEEKEKEKENNDINILIKKKLNVKEDSYVDEDDSSDSSELEEFKRKNSNKNGNKDKKNGDKKEENKNNISDKEKMENINTSNEKK